jgi:Ca2+-transporting ATPase
MPALHALDVTEAARTVGSDTARGLSELEAAQRLEAHGPNRIWRRERPDYVRIALRQVVDPLVALLAAAAAVSIVIGSGLEAAVIGLIVVMNAALGFAQELAAERAVIALREAVAERANVVREGVEREIDAEHVVPGDLLVVREGDRVAADGRIAEAHRLAVDESALTGESMPVDKDAAPVAGQHELGDRSSMVWAGTSVTRGRGAVLVTATGIETELGAVTALAREAKSPPTPLQRELAALARLMVVMGVAITAVLTAGMLLRGAELHEAFLVGVAVAVAAVPEGLSATTTIALALGARAMARAGAIVRRLVAIETLGETTVICTDKTGTLTENSLRLARALSGAEGDERTLLAGAVLSSTAELISGEEGPRIVGDPVEGALLLAAMESGIRPDELLAGRHKVLEVPFEPERRRMAVVYEESTGRCAFVKGAPEVVFSLAAETPSQELVAAAAQWAAEGLRVLAVGERRLSGTVMPDDVESGLSVLGLVALHDPLRPAAPAAIDAARDAGIRVCMLTGDHPETARTIGHVLGLSTSDVFARVTPIEKLRLVEELQAAGEVVAVTGDGINDAPALRRADVGVAMGRSGTEAAREASGIVLTDDDFATVIAAVREGRRIADNIRKFVAFLLSANFGEVVLFTLAVLGGLGAPMTVVQVLTINVLTDGLPALALARDPASPETMRLGPRRGGVLPPAMRPLLAAAGVLVGIVGLAAFLAGRAFGGGVAQTMAFATIGLAELTFVFTCRSVREPAWRVPSNRSLLAGVAASLVVLASTLYAPGLQDAFATVALSLEQVAVVAGLALAPFLTVEAGKAAIRLRSTS